jgi:hypothetical protein
VVQVDDDVTERDLVPLLEDMEEQANKNRLVEGIEDQRIEEE